MNMLDSKYQRKLLKKWAPVLESGTPIADDNTKSALAVVLENTRQYYASKGMICEATSDRGVLGPGKITATGSNGVMQGANSWPYTNPAGEMGDFYLPNVVMPILRRIFPDLMANELVGVQPLNGPIGFAMAYRPTYSDGREIAFEPVDVTYTGITADMPTDVSGAWADYAGTATFNGAGYGVLSSNEFMPLAEMPQVSFGLVKSAVEAKTRKLAAHWSPELAEDMQAMHGIDVEKEMINILSYEVGAEIDRQIVSEMVKAAIVGKNVVAWNAASADGLDQMGRLATLLTQIQVEAQRTAVRTRRGNANFAITSPTVTALLQQLSMNKYSSFKNASALPSVPDTGVGALTKVGMINDDNMLLVRDSYAAGNYVLMGYKGKHPGDSGIIYCPYVPLQLSRVLQPNTFTPSIGARTRYGVMNNPWDASRYYTFIKIEGLDASMTFGGQRHFMAPVSAITKTIG